MAIWKWPRTYRIARGESPSDAAHKALAEFGNPLLIKEVTGDIWGRTL